MNAKLCIALLFLLCTFVCSANAGESNADWKQVALDGISVSYQDSGPKDAQTLLFIHGWACDSSFWQAQMDHFADRYRCLALDLPGFGQSDKPQDIDYTLGLFAGAVKAVLDNANVSRPVLIGHSMGFAVARQFMIENPGVAEAAVNVDGALIYFPDDPAIRAEMTRMLAQFAKTFTGPQQKRTVEEFVEGVFLGKTPENVRAIVRKTMTAVDPYVCASSMGEFLNPKWWQPHTFSVPCLALYAENPMEDPRLEDNLRKEFSDLTFVLWNDTGHFLMMEKPERFNTTLQDFLDRMR